MQAIIELTHLWGQRYASIFWKVLHSRFNGVSGFEEVPQQVEGAAQNYEIRVACLMGRGFKRFYYIGESMTLG